MKKIVIIALVLFMGNSLYAQKYLTQSGKIVFFSETALEDIKAVNNQVSSVLDTSTGNMAFSLLMKAFTFEKALMQEHFNEKYVHSRKYPKSTFKGKVENFKDITLSEKPTSVIVSGKLTMHGVTQDVKTKGMLTLQKGDIIKGKAVFKIKLADYNIKVPSAVRRNIAEEIEITVNLSYEKL